MSATDICSHRGPGRDNMDAHEPHTFTDWSGRTVDCAGIPHTPTREPLEAAPRVLRAEVEPYTYDSWSIDAFAAEGRKVPTTHFQVRAVFDVPLAQNGSHWIVVTSRKMADRLAAAIEAGVAFTDFAACTNIYGEPYLGTNCRVSARHANADLKALGF